MSAFFAMATRGPILLAVLAISIGVAPAQAQGRLQAQYTITMTGITIGQIAWLADIGDVAYTTSARGKASGVLSALVDGEGAVATQGTIVEGRLTPSLYTSDITDDDGAISLRLAFAEGTATEKITPELPPRTDRLPIRDADRRGVTDPLTAVLLPEKPSLDALAPAACNRTLAIFDGRRRYNLSLFFSRMERFDTARGFSGLALVCGVVLEPIAGYRAGSLVVKYVAGKRDMELWFAPITGTTIIAPVRMVMPTLIGTLKIEALQFESQSKPMTPPEAPR